MNKPTTSFQSMYKKTASNPLKYLKGTCRFHFNLEEWPIDLSITETKTFLETRRPVISFLSEDGTFFESIEITSRIFVQMTQGVDDMYYLQISKTSIHNTKLDITIMTDINYPYHGELGDFIARVPLEK